MKLRNIYMACKRSIEPISNIRFIQKKVGITQYCVSGWNAAQTAILNNLKEIEFLKDKTAALINAIPQALITKDEFEVSSSDWEIIRNRYKELSTSLQDVINLYESMGGENNQAPGLDIKLPQCNDFNEFRECVESLDFILYKCPFFKVEGEDLKFDSMDIGSLCFTFLVVTAGTVTASVILNNVAAFIDKCYVIKSHKCSIEQQKAMIQKMDIDEETKKIYMEGTKRVYKELVNSVVAELEEETNIKMKDGEEVGFTSQAFDKAIVLLDKGMQLYSTIDAPQDVQALFKPLEMKYIETQKTIEAITQKEE